MAAFAADGCFKVGNHPSASAHEAAINLGLDVVTECMDALLRYACPDEWPPPRAQGEYAMPDKLPTRKDAAPYAEAITAGFQKHIKDFPLDDLNELTARLMQEYARACLRTADSKTDNGRNTLPDNPDVADLCRELKKGVANGIQQKAIALLFARNNEQKAASLLRQARRFRHLWQ